MKVPRARALLVISSQHCPAVRRSPEYLQRLLDLLNPNRITHPGVLVAGVTGGG